MSSPRSVEMPSSRRGYFFLSLGLGLLALYLGSAYFYPDSSISLTRTTLRTTLLLDPRVQPMTIYLGLRPASSERVKELERRVLEISDPRHPSYGKYLSVPEINQMIASSRADRRRVKRWLRDATFAPNEQLWFADAVKLTASHSKFEKLFETKIGFLHENENESGIYPVFSRKDLFKIPDSIRPIIEVIDGQYQQYHINRRSPRSGQANVEADPGFVSTQVLQRLYQIPGHHILDGNLTSVGAMEYQGGNGFSQKDLELCQKYNNLPVVSVAKNNIIGNVGWPDMESQLDVQMMAQTAPGADLWYEAYPGWMFAWANDFFNRKSIPYIVSISWGWSETDQCSIGLGICGNSTSRAYVRRCNYEFMKMAARGVSILVSSGDAGSPGRVEEDCVMVNNSTMNPVFPGSSKWVTSVGATYIQRGSHQYPPQTPACNQMHCANGTLEREVTRTELFWTSGAGFDHWEQTPAWQFKEVLKYVNSGVDLPPQKYWNRGGRAYPDVSAIGHNCAVREDSFWTGVDGTSCSSPVFAGILAILNDHQMKQGKPRLGFANPLLYSMARIEPSTFHDISHGNSSCTEFSCCGPDYGFLARAGGWDPVTGLGTPNVQKMLAWLDRHT